VGSEVASVSEWMVQITLRTDVDVVRVRQAADQLARRLGFGTRTRARLDLVVAELATNVVRHADHGVIRLVATASPPAGIRILCQDDGPGLAGPAIANGGNTAGLGLGLAVVHELANDVRIDSEAGHGTRVEANVWE
jgi:serine/threonine-protein kinase RsbT